MFDKMDVAFGYMVFANTLGLLPFHTFKLRDLLSGNWPIVIRYSFYACTLLLTAWTASSANARMGEMIPWLNNQLKVEPTSTKFSNLNSSRSRKLLKYRIQLLVAEINHGVGLKGK
ncbi:unnamed protein product, partial [Allacma fusca]